MRLARRSAVRASVPIVGTLLLALSAGPAVAGEPAAAPESPAMSSLRSARPAATGGARAHSAATTPARDGKVRLGIVLRPGADAAEVERSAHGQGAQTAHRLDRLRYLSVSVPAAAAERVAAALSRRSDVAEVAPVAKRQPSYVPDDSYWGNQQSYLSAIAAPAAWDVSQGSAAVKVAVVDTGVDVAHPDLAGKVVGARNSMAGAPNQTDVQDNVGHGTHVAGIAAAASDNALGVVGTGFDASLLAVKAGDVDGFWDDDISAGIVWAADNGARVVNLSLGGSTTTTALNSAVAYAQGKGALVVAAAGNAGSSVPSYPAAISGVVAVGATDAAGDIAPFSNHGSWVTLAAPGMGILSTVPTAGSQMGAAPTSGYAYADGTSMASPIVAGEAALLMAAVPNATTAQIRSALVASAHGYAGLGLGAGQVDMALALTKLPPATTPSITAPSADAVVAGAATLTATSAAPSVRFLVDGSPVGSLVTVTDGTATTTWETWGLADGPHSLTALSCNDYGCGPVSATVPVTVANPAVTIAAPTAGAVVSAVTGVDVTTTDAAPKVRLVVDGQPVGLPVAVSANAAHLDWDTAGWANGSHALGVAPCTGGGSCGTPSGTVSVDVQNAVPALTAPATGQLASGQFTLVAGAASGGVRFLLDGAVIGFDGSAPFTLTKNFSLVADGWHDLTLQPCDTSGSRCAGPAGTTRIGVKSLHPVLKTTSPSVFSPNGDRRADTTTFTYYLPSTQSASWSVRNAVGTVVRGPVRLGTLTAGTRTAVWDGKTSTGSRAGNGTYTLWLSTVMKDSAGRTLSGLSTRGVRVDTVAPGLSVSAVTSTFYPVVDGYRDTIVPKLSVTEPVSVTLTVRNSAGAIVRTIVTRRSAAGAFTMSWNGRNNAGTLQPAGTYKYSFLAQDAALNRRASASYSVPLSLKKLVATAAIKTVTPYASMTSLIKGSCSRVAPDPDWAGGFDYLSGYVFFETGVCPDPNDPILDVAGSTHQLTLPAAVKYAGISVAATGMHVDPQYPNDEAYAWYRDSYGNGVGGVVLGSDYATYSLGPAAPSLLYKGNVLRWTVATDSGQYYAVRTFTVRYTYYVLK